MINLNINVVLGGNSNGVFTFVGLESLKMILRGSGYFDQVSEEISMVMNILVNYGILNILGLNQIFGFIMQSMFIQFVIFGMNMNLFMGVI